MSTNPPSGTLIPSPTIDDTELHPSIPTRPAAHSHSLMDDLLDIELLWRDRYDWLLSCGYQLRPRLRPDWVPSWIVDPSKDRWSSTPGEDTIWGKGWTIDATRLTDGKVVILKTVLTKDMGSTGHETDIACYLSSPVLQDDPENHCVKILEVLNHPDDDSYDILVMPLLRPFDSPRFETVGEGVDFFQQAFKGLQFLHKHRIAHRDCTGPNIMMDCDLYPDGWHAMKPTHNREYTGPPKQMFTRTQKPPRYLWIDFGLSVHFKDPSRPPPFHRDFGTDKTVPEFQGRLKDRSPFDPFAADIYYLGNLVRLYFLDGDMYLPVIHGFEFMRPLVNEMTAQNPEDRPNINECVARLDEVISALPQWRLRSQVTYSTDWIYGYIWRLLPYLWRLLSFILRDVPAIPCREGGS